MAIRPVDLQAAYLAAPQNAAVADSVQSAPQIAQEAAQTTFTAQLRKREESVGESAEAEGNAVRPRGEGESESHHPHSDDREAPSEEGTGLGLAGGGEHFIDVTA